MHLTLICGINQLFASQLCAILNAIGFSSFEPFIETNSDSRFNAFQSASLHQFLQQFGNHQKASADIYKQTKLFAENLKQAALNKNNNRFYLYHPQLHLLIPYLKHEFKIRVIFLQDSLVEPDREIETDEWQSFYQQRHDYNTSILGLIENQNFPYIFINSSELYQNRVGVLKKIINFHRLKVNAEDSTFNILQRNINKILQRFEPRIMPLKKVAIVTAYAKESLETLQKCIASVKQQTVGCVHIMVADGYPNPAIASQTSDNLLHITLPKNIGFNQCGVGVELAFAMGFDVVGILDADNWFEPGHIEAALQLINDKNADVVFARRKVIFPDGELLTVVDPQDNTGVFADTNCLVLTRKVAAITPIWLMWPKSFGAGEDRAVSLCIRMLNFNVLMTADETVWYQTNWAHHYKLQNKKPVAPLRRPAAEFATSFNHDIFYRATGYSLPIRQAAEERDIPCVDFSKCGIIVTHDSALDVSSYDHQFASTYTVLVMHQGNFSAVANSAVHTYELPNHNRFYSTSWTLGASLLFQTGCDVVVLLDSLKRLDEVSFDAMLKLCEQSCLDAILCSESVDHKIMLSSVFITRNAMFFAAIWNQLNHIAPEYRVEACENYLKQKNVKYIHLKNSTHN